MSASRVQVGRVARSKTCNGFNSATCDVRYVCCFHWPCKLIDRCATVYMVLFSVTSNKILPIQFSQFRLNRFYNFLTNALTTFDWWPILRRGRHNRIFIKISIHLRKHRNKYCRGSRWVTQVLGFLYFCCLRARDFIILRERINIMLLFEEPLHVSSQIHAKVLTILHRTACESSWSEKKKEEERDIENETRNVSRRIQVRTTLMRTISNKILVVYRYYDRMT